MYKRMRKSDRSTTEVRQDINAFAQMSVEIRQKDFANFAQGLQTVKTCPAFIRDRYPFKLFVRKLSSQLESFKTFAFLGNGSEKLYQVPKS